MNRKLISSKAVMALLAAGILGAATWATSSSIVTAQSTKPTAAQVQKEASAHALDTLNSFYKPALKGQFPGTVAGLTVGKSSKKDVIKLIGEPSIAGKGSLAFDLYSANMGNPGYAFSYAKGTIQEMRYFGTNVERQTNIGGITMKMLMQYWFAPDAASTIKNGKAKQTKLTYLRGDFKLEFVFNSSTDLDHINLLKN
ncbi:YjgB family protein [Paenibacillus timonensis]|uniref:YjgB family protein n=1 Tax=Paenibacillus timonensis TaxID=225915 RepID=A0ABW3SAI6_9BACL|nr:YjgB family protein [Paenibacillus timonensis]MCH1639978.1 YjgB family protein [Paenibacillus timonensis]